MHGRSARSAGRRAGSGLLMAGEGPSAGMQRDVEGDVQLEQADRAGAVDAERLKGVDEGLAQLRLQGGGVRWGHSGSPVEVGAGVVTLDVAITPARYSANHASAWGFPAVHTSSWCSAVTKPGPRIVKST